MSWQARTAKIAVGDKVCFKASFLRNTGQMTGETPHMRGEYRLALLIFQFEEVRLSSWTFG